MFIAFGYSECSSLLREIAIGLLVTQSTCLKLYICGNCVYKHKLVLGRKSYLPLLSTGHRFVFIPIKMKNENCHSQEETKAI